MQTEKFFFSTWPKRQDYRFTQPRTCNFTESREEENVNQVTHNAPQVFVSATVWQVLGGECCVSVGWNWKVGKWMAEMSKYIHIYLHVCISGKYIYSSTVVKYFSPTHVRGKFCNIYFNIFIWQLFSPVIFSSFPASLSLYLCTSVITSFLFFPFSAHIKAWKSSKLEIQSFLFPVST